MWRVIAIRAASIWRDVIQPHSVACRPKSPNAMSNPPLARPRMRPFCALRYLVLFGESIVLLLGPDGRRDSGAARRQHLALEDPALHADLAVGGIRLGEAVLDV